MQEDDQYFMQRGQNYKHVFDPESGWMRPKDLANWKADFDPYQHEHGFNESNAAQSSWFVPHDLARFIPTDGAGNKLLSG